MLLVNMSILTIILESLSILRPKFFMIALILRDIKCVEVIRKFFASLLRNIKMLRNLRKEKYVKTYIQKPDYMIRVYDVCTLDSPNSNQPALDACVKDVVPKEAKKIFVRRRNKKKIKKSLKIIKQKTQKKKLQIQQSMDK